MSTLDTPLPSNLGEFVADYDAAIRLGKALFWDIQTGSDSLTACATCHYNAGADNRVRNQARMGADGEFDPALGGTGGPNAQCNASDFPFLKRSDPNEHESTIVSHCDDVHGSQGVPLRDFVSVDPGEGLEVGTPNFDADFNVDGLNVNQVTGRNTPTNINAVHFVRQFWDGRADFNFNGETIWGARDTEARVHHAATPGGACDKVQVLLDHASLASQAVGPPLSGTEMSWGGKTFEDLGRKMVPMAPLQLQIVDPTDVHIGHLADTSGDGRGLIAGLTYEDLIKEAFLPEWWQGAGDPDSGFTHMEENFHLYWGLALLCYQSILISDQTPWDVFVSSGPDAPGSLTANQLKGLNIFESGGTGCVDCHVPPLFGGGFWHQLLVPEPGIPIGAATERMPMANGGTEGFVLFSTVPGPGNPTFDEHGNPIWYIPFDPRGKEISIIAPDGLVIAYGDTPPDGDCIFEGESETELSVDIPPCDPLHPDPPAEFVVAIETLGETLSDGTCALLMEIEGGGDHCAGLQAGDYHIIIDGVDVGLLTLPESNPDRVYDLGFYNLGLESPSEDIGIGGDGPFGPLSFVRRIQNGDPDVEQFDLDPPISPDELVAINGAFKAVSLRNIKYTGPYMHDGSMATLEQVLQFYSRGGDFQEGNNELDECMTGMGKLRNKPFKQQAVIDFIANGLLDQRVVIASDVFCRPSLPLKAGHIIPCEDNGSGEAIPEIIELPATGADGGEPIQTFIDRLTVGGVNVLFDESPILSEQGVVGCSSAGTLTDSIRSVRVVLPKRPMSGVFLTISLSDPSELTINGVSQIQLVFNPDNWFDPRLIEVMGIQDGEVDGSQICSMIFNPTISVDSEFNGLLIDPITFTILDSTDATLTLYVDPVDHQDFQNGTAEFPYGSISAALACPDSLTARIDLGPHTYNEDVSIEHRPAHLYSADGATIVGTGSSPALTVFGANSAGTTLTGLTVTSGWGPGGGVFVSDSTNVTMDGMTITGNVGQVAGGVLVRNSSACVLANSTVVDNHSDSRGGGISCEGGSLEVIDSMIDGNTAVAHGGGVATINGASMSMVGTVLSGNSAAEGGALYHESGLITLSGSQVMGNSAANNGGGMLVMNQAALHLDTTKVANNLALGLGGGLYADGGTIDCTNVTIASNGGYQVWRQNSATFVLNSTIIWGSGDGQSVGSNVGHSLGDVSFSILDTGSNFNGTWSTEDPLFVDPGSGDHNVQPGSPAIDAGDPELGDDPDGSARDIGSHPWVG